MASAKDYKISKNELLLYIQWTTLNMIIKTLKVSNQIIEKLLHKHRVDITEIEECFLNRTKEFLEDTRLDRKTEPPTEWFIAKTDHDRWLKVVFIRLADGTFEIKSAFEPNLNEVNIYEKYA